MFFNPQSTATTLTGFPLPYTLTSYKKTDHAVNTIPPLVPQNTGKKSSRRNLYQHADWCLTINLQRNLQKYHHTSLHFFFVQVEIIILFYILLITAVTAIPKKSLVSIANDKLFFPLFHLISSEVAKSLLTDHYSSRELPDTWGEIFS